MELLPTGDYRYRVTDRQGQESVVPRGEIWHLRGLSSDGMMGLSPIAMTAPVDASCYEIIALPTSPESS